MLFNCTLTASIPRGTKAAKVLEGQTETLDAMADLLGSLTDVSALDAGVIRPTICDFPVERIFGRLRTEFELEAASSSVMFVVERSDHVIRSDACLLERAVRNLAANAMRYTRTGEVRVLSVLEERCVRIEVRDTGVGIPADKLQAIFDDYYQLDPEVSGGIGLGLAIVKRFVDALGHTLDVHSRPNEGSCFAITIPQGTMAGR